jgi:beta-glucosidase
MATLLIRRRISGRPPASCLVFTLFSILLMVACRTVRHEDTGPAYLDPDRPVDVRVEDLLSRMTLEEKVGQINWPCVYMDGFGKDIPAKRDGVRKFVVGELVGIGPGGGFFTLANEISREGTRQQAETFNELQRLALEKTRLKIPLMQVEEGTHGFMAPGATIFPEGMALGATWNTGLIEKVYSAAAREARATGVHQLFTLVIEPNRDPRHGRNQQTYSEDPFLCSRIAEAIVQGAQGHDIAAGDKVIAGLCHYPGQTQGLNGINRGTVDLSERTIREVFLPPWEAGIRKAGALGVMATHPSINGYPNHGSEKYLTTILRDELGFRGNVLSEGSNTGTLLYERVVATEKEAGPIVLKAGVDVNITFESGYMEDMIENVTEGKVPEELLDRAVRRILRLKFMLGLFEDPFVDADRAVGLVHSTEHQDLALEAAREGIVLLKNEQHLLPLDPNIRSIAVIGPNADDRENLLGDYIPKKLLYQAETVLEAIKAKVSDGTSIHYVMGCHVLDSALNEVSAARNAAAQADVAIVVVGEDKRTDGESDDAADLDLTGYQADLIRAVHGTGTPTIVVLISGRPLTIRWTATHVPAVIQAWMCGEMGAEAIADVLFGDYNPCGRLPITFPRHVGQMPFYYNYKPAKFNRLWRAYVTYPLTPLWPFGHGLSYTEFEYANLRIYPDTIAPDDTVNIRLDIQNVGDLAGKEVVQLYIDDVISSMVTPIIELRGFDKISLDPGERKSVSFRLAPSDLSLLNREMDRVVEPGTFDVMVGRSCEDIRLKGSFEVVDRNKRHE